VTLLVVSDTVQVPDVIIGRAWLDLPEVAYHKSGGRLHIYKAEPNDSETEVTADMLGNEADYLHAVEVDVLPVKRPLSTSDFGYVNSELSADDEAKLLGLVNEYRDCFATNLDDMVIDGTDLSDLLTKLRSVLERLKSAALTLKPSKCLFGTKSIEFLGLVVGGGEIRPGLKKTRVINEYPVPEDAYSLGFLGLASFFRRFIPKFVLISVQLNKITKKGERFCWDEKREIAFRKLQTALVSDTVLTLFRPDAAITELHTDASTIGLGAMLLQSVKLGDPLRVVYYASRKTSDAETRYHSNKLELLCLVWSMNKLRQFLLGVRFVVYTDCKR